ncbi:hypothetical protein WI69_02390 [Burkholderia diffusa]|nr:hypothetical protein WI69_02390 [Burkholderia diffusa]
MSEQKLTIEQAYRAMFYLLEHEYELTRSDELGGMLSSLSWQIWEGDQGPADPAAWQDAVQKALTTNENAAPSDMQRQIS